MDLKRKTVVAVPVMNPLWKGRLPGEVTEPTSVIVHHYLVDLPKVGVCDRVLSVTSRVKDFFPDLAHERKKRIIVVNSDSHRKYFRKESDRFLKGLGSAVVEGNAEDIALIAVEAL